MGVNRRCGVEASESAVITAKWTRPAPGAISGVALEDPQRLPSVEADQAGFYSRTGWQTGRSERHIAFESTGTRSLPIASHRLRHRQQAGPDVFLH